MVELKSQIGSISNNANNRIEEMIGQATDLWTAYREGLLGPAAPWFGYVVLVEDSIVSQRRAPEPSVEPRFPPDRLYTRTNYIERYAIALSRLRDAQQMNGVCLVAASRDGQQWYPDESMTFQAFAEGIHARADLLRAEFGDIAEQEHHIDVATRRRVRQLTAISEAEPGSMDEN